MTYCHCIKPFSGFGPETLLELNTSLLRFLISRFGLAADLRFTTEYSRDGQIIDETLAGSSPSESSILRTDLREAIHPKRPNTILKDLQLEKPYFQVFAQKHGFQSDLSSIDLLFNEGPESVLYLKKI